MIRRPDISTPEPMPSSARAIPPSYSAQLIPFADRRIFSRLLSDGAAGAARRMDPMQVLVLQNDVNSPISLLGDYLQAAGAKLTTLLPHNGDEVPERPKGYDGAVILGGPQHAHD